MSDAHSKNSLPGQLAYTIFVAENLQAFVLGVSKCKTLIPIKYLIAAQLLVVLPLSMIRNLAALSSTALIADAFILIGRELIRDGGCVNGFR